MHALFIINYPNVPLLPYLPNEWFVWLRNVFCLLRWVEKQHPHKFPWQVSYGESDETEQGRIKHTETISSAASVAHRRATFSNHQGQRPHNLYSVVVLAAALTVKLLPHLLDNLRCLFKEVSCSFTLQS